MKKLLLVFIVFYVFTGISVFAQFQYPSFKWVNTEHDFGKIQHQIPVVFEFEFTNKGQAPLIISEVEGSCGCTATHYTKEPVLPGQKGKIKATYDAAALGKFRKSITVTANVEGGREYLYIKGTVVKESLPESP